jgi:hypothetical protein
MNIKSSFWWKLRDAWHYPQMYKQCVKPNTFWDESNYYYILWHKARYSSIFFLILRHTQALIERGYWYFWWKIGLRCNGNDGGWRTKICDWLEDKAREDEND